MNTQSRRIGFAIVPIGVMIGGALFLGACQSDTSDGPKASPTSALADDEDTGQPDDSAPGMLAKGIMQSIGAIPAPPKHELNYEQRAPLVVPKDVASLPKPETGDVYGMKPGWPVDEDVAEANRMRAEAAEYDTTSRNATGNRYTSPEEVEAIRQVLAQSSEGDAEERAKAIAEAQKLTPAQQQQLFKALKTREFYNANGSPVRVSLQNPPEQYLAPETTAPVTTEEPDYIKKAKHKNSWFGGLFDW